MGQLDWINFDSQRTQREGLPVGHVVVVETGNYRYQQLLCSGRHMMLADRSEQDGGKDSGPNPQQLILMALGSHLSMTLRADANKRGWPLEQILVRFVASAADRSQETSLLHHFLCLGARCAIEFVGSLDETQQAQLVETANRQLCGWRALAGMQEV